MLRFLLQIFGLLLIVLCGWNRPYRDVGAQFMPWAGLPPSRLALLKARYATPKPVPGAPAENDSSTPAPGPFSSTSSLNRRGK